MQGNLYSQAQLKIGTIHPYDSYYYEINLINNSNNIKVGQCFVSENPFNPYNTGALYLDEHHDLYVNTINVDYSTQYRLEVTSYYGTGGDNLYEDIDWYIFLPTNAVISGDSIIGFGSGDYTAKDNTIAVTGAIQEQTDTITDLLTSSGDASLVVLPSYDFSGDISTNFFTFILNNIEDVFLETDEASIVLPILGSNVELSSEDFNVLPSALVPILGGYHWFWVCLMILKDIRKMFEHLKSGEFEKIASDDINANLV